MAPPSNKKNVKNPEKVHLKTALSTDLKKDRKKRGFPTPSDLENQAFAHQLC